MCSKPVQCQSQLLVPDNRKVLAAEIRTRRRREERTNSRVKTTDGFMIAINILFTVLIVMGNG